MTSPPACEPDIHKLFRIATKVGATELILKSDQAPHVKLRGIIRRMELNALSQRDLEALLNVILTAREKRVLANQCEVEFSHYFEQSEWSCRVDKPIPYRSLSFLAKRVEH